MHFPRDLGLLILALVVAGCGGQGGTGKDDQSSPQAVVSEAYAHIAEGEFEALCGLVLPDALDKFRARGTDCQTYLARQYDAGSRAAMRDARVDPALVQTNGDTAVVPEHAVTFDGQPSEDDDTTVVRKDGRWWLTLDS